MSRNPPDSVCVTPTRHIVTDALAESTVTMYFSVFPCNCEPIFCSNRIPLLREAPPYCDGNVVYIGPAREVAQQKLQQLAFPRGFGCKNMEVRSGPSYSARFEQVRKRGVLRYHRIKIASTFVALVVSENGELRTIQAKHTAVAVVITCPPNTPHYDTLLQNFDSVLRYALHVSLDFAMWATQRFFLKLSRTAAFKELVAELEQHDRALETYSVVGAILANALTYTSPIPRICSGASVTVASSASERLQSSSHDPAVSPVRNSGVFSSNPNVLVYEALRKLRGINERFTSRVVAGFLSVSCWEGYGLSYRNGTGICVCNGIAEAQQQKGQQLNLSDGRSVGKAAGFKCDADDIYADYWQFMEEEERQREKEAHESLRNVSGGTNSDEHEPGGDESDVWKSEPNADIPESQAAVTEERNSSPHATESATSGTSALSCPLSLSRVGRVVIFCTDPEIAKCLMILAAFFMRDRRVIASTTAPDMTPFAGRVESCAHSSLPVQWLMEDYNPRRFERLLCSPFTVENIVLVIDPRSLVCQRLRVHKTFSVSPILVERFGERHPVVRPFQKLLLGNVRVASDAVITSALRLACKLHKLGDPSSSCTKFLEWFVVCLVGRCHAIRFEKGLNSQLIKEVSPSPSQFPHSVDERSRIGKVESPSRINDGDVSFLDLISNVFGNDGATSAGGPLPHRSTHEMIESIFSGPKEGSQLLQYLPYDE